MKRKLPPIKSQNRILIVCEGYEENDYIQRLKQCEVWDKSISVEFANAKSIDNISALYSYEYSLGNYNLIVVFCDTEKYPYKQFRALKKKINDFHGNRAADHIVFFANPCTLQIVLSHFEKVRLTTSGKADNAPIIKKLTGIEDYRATESQRSALMKKITAENYATMEKNISELNDTYTSIPGSNVLELFYSLDNGNKAWIKETNKKIEKR